MSRESAILWLMPIPRSVARMNKRYLNHATVRLAPWFPGLGVVTHLGRHSGRSYRTPVNVFVIEGGYLIALTYGIHADWVKNVLAADGCVLTTRGREVRLHNPHIVHDETRSDIRRLERQVLRALQVADFLVLDLV